MIRKAILFFNRDPESDSDEDDWGWGCTLRECIESPRGSAPCAHRQAGVAARSAIADTRIRRTGEEAERPGGCKSRLLQICHGKCQSKVL